MSIWTHDGSYTATNISLKTLLSSAYGFRDGLISGVPGWAEPARFDVNAKIVDPDMETLKKLGPKRGNPMLIPILTERFHVRVHTETKIGPMYELVVAKGGPKFKESPPAEKDADPAKPGAGRGGMTIRSNEMTANAVPISSLTNQLSGQLDRTVVDKTGLTGRYDLHLKWTPEQAAIAGQDDGQRADLNDAAPSVFTALEEQLGLKLQPIKGPVETLVVDHAEMPTEN